MLEAECHPPSVWRGEWTSCSPNPCPATTTGPNLNGAIIVHTNDAYTYLSTTICTTTRLPETCADAITRTDKSAGAVVWFLAAFLPTVSPRVAAIHFGINYDDVNLDPSVKKGMCAPAGSLEAPDSGWPSNTAGNSVAFGTPMVGVTLFPFYYFVVDEYSGGTAVRFLCSSVNPTFGYAAFFDDSFPTGVNNVTRFGCINWYGDGGMNDCPQVQPALGACCDLLGNCTMTSQANCLAPSLWLPETTCEPNPCPGPTPAEKTTWGKIKASYR
jgi:hypothetical protein